MSKSLSNLFILILSIAGGLIAILLTVEHYTPDFSLPCGPIAGGCRGVLNSDYGALWHIPTSIFGLGMYALLAFLCLRRSRRLRDLRAAETSLAAAYATSGAAASGETPDSAPAEQELTAAAPSEPAPTPASVPANAVTPNAAAGLRAEVVRLDTAVWVLALLGFGISWWLQYTALFVVQGFCPWCFTSALLITLIFILASRDHLLAGRQITGEQKLLATVLAFIVVLLGIVYWGDIWKRLHDQMIQAMFVQAGRPKQVVTQADLIAPPNMHTKGDPKAPFLLVEFADYQCEGCKKGVAATETVLQEKGNLVRLAFRNFPLRMHQWSLEAAKAAEAAGRQGKFWEMHDYLYEHQDEMKKSDFTPLQFNDFAQAIGCDAARYAKERDDDQTKQLVKRDIDVAQMAGLNETPTFFLVNMKTKKIWQFAGVKQLLEVMSDTSQPMWK